jgi:DNA-directed RNA polymerase specialized sigma24 family protein
MDVLDSNGAPRDGGGTFPETSWTTIEHSRSEDPEIAFAALSRLAERYQPALRTFLLRCGCPPQEAEDVLQEFLTRRFLQESFLGKADPEAGLFRSFLRTCLRRFLISHHRSEARRIVVHSPGTTETATVAFTAPEAERLLDRLWAEQMIANARARLRAEAAAAGRAELCMALEGLLESEPTPGWVQEVSKGLGMTPNAVWVAAHRFRERLKWFIQDEVRQTVREPADWRAELEHLVAALRA